MCVWNILCHLSLFHFQLASLFSIKWCNAATAYIWVIYQQPEIWGKSFEEKVKLLYTVRDTHSFPTVVFCSYVWIPSYSFLKNFLLLFNYSCSNISPIAPPCPARPFFPFPQSIPAMLSLSLGPLYLFFDLTHILLLRKKIQYIAGRVSFI